MLNATNTEIEATKVNSKHLVEMLDLIDKGTLSGPAAKAVFEDMFRSGKTADRIEPRDWYIPVHPISGPAKDETLDSDIKDKG